MIFLQGPAKNTQVIAAHSLKEFFQTLKKPRKVMFMVKAGAPVDELIEECLPFLEKGDILIDGGNSHYPDTERRVKELKAKGILFIGAGFLEGKRVRAMALRSCLAAIQSLAMLNRFFKRLLPKQKMEFLAANGWAMGALAIM